MPLLGNTMLFLDTGFFKDYKKSDSAYEKLFKYSREGAIRLCTSEICVHEWRSGKIHDLQKVLKDISGKVANSCGHNYFARQLLTESYYSELHDIDYLKEKSRQLGQSFLDENNIQHFPAIEAHIGRTWEAYFDGSAPFKERKNRNDIPDSWIYESAIDAISASDARKFGNKFCLTNDKTMQGCLENLGFLGISLLDLIAQLNDEENAVEVGEHSSPSIVNEKAFNTLTPAEGTTLHEFLSKSSSETTKQIYLRLAGFVEPLNTPTHNMLIDAVVAKGFDRNLTQACAVILSEKPNQYIKDTGNHYIIGNKEFCEEASDLLMGEIIDMLGDD